MTDPRMSPLVKTITNTVRAMDDAASFTRLYMRIGPAHIAAYWAQLASRHAITLEALIESANCERDDYQSACGNGHHSWLWGPTDPPEDVRCDCGAVRWADRPRASFREPAAKGFNKDRTVGVDQITPAERARWTHDRKWMN